MMTKSTRQMTYREMEQFAGSKGAKASRNWRGWGPEPVVGAQSRSLLLLQEKHHLLHLDKCAGRLDSKHTEQKQIPFLSHANVALSAPLFRPLLTLQ